MSDGADYSCEGVVTSVEAKTFLSGSGESVVTGATVTVGDGDMRFSTAKPLDWPVGRRVRVEVTRLADEGTNDKTNSSHVSFVDRQKPQFVTDKPGCASGATDSWGKLEEDAKKGHCEYFGDRYCGECPADRLGDCEVAMASDILSRAKALAGEGDE